VWDNIWAIIVIVAVIAGAYYVTYFLGSRAARVQSAREIKILDRFSLSKDKAFYLVQVKGKVYFIAMAHQSAALIDTFDGSEFESETPKRMSFKEALAFSSSSIRGAPGWLAGIISRGAAGKGGGDKDAGGETGGDGTEKSGGEDAEK
jgi:flagellar biogenesis protein FliO